MRIVDWSSDGCSSDLLAEYAGHRSQGIEGQRQGVGVVDAGNATRGADRRMFGSGEQAREPADTLRGNSADLRRPLRVARKPVFLTQHIIHQIFICVTSLRPVVGIETDSATMEEIPIDQGIGLRVVRSEEHTSELQSLMRISYAVFGLKKKNTK